MAYAVYGDKMLIFCANVRTGSTAIANALMEIGAKRDVDHHSDPVFIPENAIVFQVVRCPFEVLNSLWWKAKPHGNFEKFIREACAGNYEHVKVPMYWRTGITHTIYYAPDLQEPFDKICRMAGIEPPRLQRTLTRTAATADEMFSDYLREMVLEAFGPDINRLGLWK